ncbi:MULTISPECIES: DUF4405 domain-containing protein [unclassified Sulfurospirillum]|uniref:DUF4405 domain-containing protein n=1 Tax=unclassified Sulfurospirillum TaxID=2618290 RepID=UPI000505F9F0|nr:MULTISPECIES: DUF4405 domain-containing protein [unclassified Sulfurospirillum]KFL34277.1 hypothetical protein JU57_07015 [Sulfurospirillum sp. SCADC]
MKVIPRNVLSAVLTVVFVVVSITGVLMYFKIRMFSVQSLHIWLGFAFAIAGCLHLFKNWSGFLSYFKKRSTMVSIAFALCVTATFIILPLINPQAKNIFPKNQLFSAMLNAPLSKVAAFVALDEEMMAKKLADHQILASHKQSVSEIAKANEKSNDEVLNIVFSAPKAP